MKKRRTIKGSKRNYYRHRRIRRNRITRAQYEERIRLLTRIGIGVLAAVAVIVLLLKAGGKKSEEDLPGVSAEEYLEPEYNVQLLSYNEYSRPGILSDQIQNVVVHYTANPGSTAQENRDYFEGLKDSHTTHVSSHFIIGLEGEIIQCVPTEEYAYASNELNSTSVSIECCHPDETGKFTKETYDSLVQATAWLCSKYELTSENVIRHYDVTQKNCPKWFVEDPEAWSEFLSDVQEKLDEAYEKCQ